MHLKLLALDVNADISPRPYSLNDYAVVVISLADPA